MVDPLDELDQLTRDVYLPLLCTNDSSTTVFGLHPDKLMDVLHRLMAYVTTTQGHAKVRYSLFVQILNSLPVKLSNIRSFLNQLKINVISKFEIVV